jgi:uncharacterized protein (DUF885 family)
VYQSAPTGFVEGWALYTETLGYVMDVSDDNPQGFWTNPVDRLGFHTNSMLRNNRIKEDPALHGNISKITAWSYDEAWQEMESNGFSSGMSKSETQRYVTMAGQATAYMLGRLKIEEMKNYTMKSLGAAFSAPEFHNILTRWGGASLSNLDLLIHTYVAVKLGTLDGVPMSDSRYDGLFGIDMIRDQFSSSLPLVGLGQKQQ